MKKYAVINEWDDAAEFSRRVEGMLADGWELQGGVSVAAYCWPPTGENGWEGGDAVVLAQAFVREEP